MCRTSGNVHFAEKNCGQTLSHKGLVKHDEIVKDHMCFGIKNRHYKTFINENLSMGIQSMMINHYENPENATVYMNKASLPEGFAHYLHQ